MEAGYHDNDGGGSSGGSGGGGLSQQRARSPEGHPQAKPKFTKALASSFKGLAALVITTAAWLAP